MKTNTFIANTIITIKDIIECAILSYITILLWRFISNKYNLDHDEIISLLTIFMAFGAINFVFTLLTGLLAYIRNRGVSDPELHDRITRPTRLLRPLFATLILFLISLDWLKYFVDNHNFIDQKHLYISLIHEILIAIFLLFFSYYLLNIIRNEIYLLIHTTFPVKWYNRLYEQSSYQPFRTDTKIIKDISEIVTLLLIASSTTATEGISIIQKITNSSGIIPENDAFGAGIAFIPILASLIAWEYWKPTATKRQATAKYDPPLETKDYFKIIFLYALFTVGLAILFTLIAVLFNQKAFELFNQKAIVFIPVILLLPMAITGGTYRRMRKESASECN